MQARFRRLRDAYAQQRDISPRDEQWLNAFAVWIHAGHGPALLQVMEESGIATRTRPWFDAVKAHLFGSKDYLLNVPDEARRATEAIYHEIEDYKALLGGE